MKCALPSIHDMAITNLNSWKKAMIITRCEDKLQLVLQRGN
jgi:hypothetical protein